MNDQFTIFIGFSDDAKTEAERVYSLEKHFQKTLKLFDSYETASFRHLKMFLWSYDADLGQGGQEKVITPHLAKSHIAIFIFNKKIGTVTWEELEYCRNNNIPVIAIFPTKHQQPETLDDLQSVKNWCQLLEKKKALIQDWNTKNSTSITPIDTYNDINHLESIVKDRIPDLFPRILNSNTVQAASRGLQSIKSNSFKSGSFNLEDPSTIFEYDPNLVKHYCSMLRNEKKSELPSDIGEQEFLIREGFIINNFLTYNGILLFGKNISQSFPSAYIRLTKYEGIDKSSPRKRWDIHNSIISQIIESRKFIENNIETRDLISNNSISSEKIFEYPMKCLREIIANAVCHRDYQDFERIIYVRIFNNRIEISNPGNWGNNKILDDQVLKLSECIGHPVEKNITLAKSISSVSFMEMEGSGLETAILDCKSIDAPEPTLVQKSGFVTVTIFPRRYWGKTNLKIKSNIEINPSLTFDNFIEGDCNRLARSAGIAVANKPGGTSFNPLMIFSETGMGKTHLVHAIGNMIKQNSKNKIVLYVPIEKFINQFVEAIRNNSNQDFINYYEQADVLIVDEVQLLENKQKTQEIFFTIFNHLYQLGKQIVLTSDKAPKDLRGIDERLLSRFKWGLSVDLQTPDFETRLAILEHMMYDDSIKLDREVVEYVAHNINTNVRELQGALVSLLAQASLNRKEVSLDLAKQILKNFIKNNPREISIEYIQKLVCDYFTIPVEQVKSKTRKREIVLARQISMFYAKDLTKSSLKTIGMHFGGRDHMTVIRACQTINDLMETDKKTRTDIEEIGKRIRMNLI